MVVAEVAPGPFPIFAVAEFGLPFFVVVMVLAVVVMMMVVVVVVLAAVLVMVVAAFMAALPVIADTAAPAA